MSSGTFGFKGLKDRALEIPAGVTTALSVDVSPSGRARLRYNDIAKQLEQSVDGGAYTPLGGTGAGPWDQVGTNVYPDSTSWNVIVGATSTSGSEKLRVVGDTLSEGSISVLNDNINMLGIAESTIGGGAKAPDTQAGKRINYNAGEGGNSDGVSAGGVGGSIQISAARGGNSDPSVGIAGAGGTVTVTGGDGGPDLGAGGAPGGNIVLRGGTGSGGQSDGYIEIGDQNTTYVRICSAVNRLGFFGSAPAVKQNVVGALSAVTDANAKAVLTSVILALATLGLVNDNTT
jgi:uncharacterized membrane protein